MILTVESKTNATPRAILAAICLLALGRPAISQVTPGTALTVSSASYSALAGVASNSIAATFGSNLATTTVSASTQPLPTSLAGTTVTITDSSGMMQMCPLFFVSPGQVNHLIPAGTAMGAATVKVTSGDGTVTTVSGVQIVLASSGIFSANSTGSGPAVAYAQRFLTDGTVVNSPLSIYDPGLKRFVSQPIDLGGPGDQTYITLFGTGLRALPATAFRALLNGTSHSFPVSFVGAQEQFAGLDQVNIGPILASDATGAFESGLNDMTISLLSISSSGVAESNQLLFRIIHPDFLPAAQLLTSDAVIRGQTVQQFSVWGNYFAPSGKLSISPPDGITISNISVFDTKIAFDLAVDANATTGDRQLLIDTPYGRSKSVLKLSIRDSASPNPFLTALTITSNTIAFNFASAGAQLIAGSNFNYSANEVDYTKNVSSMCQGSYTSNALIYPGQTSGSIQYMFLPSLANSFFSGHHADVSFSVTDAGGRQSNTLSTRVEDPVFGCKQIPTGQ